MRRAALCVLALAGLLPACAPRAPRPAIPGALVSADAPALLARVRAPGARATIVNVWATWCAPCREEMPALLAVAREQRGHGLRLVLVSADFDDARPAIARFLAGQGLSDTTYLKSGDDQGFIAALSPRWSGSLPATFVYDGSGRLLEFWEGMADRDRFERAVSAAFASRSTRTGGTTP